MKFILFLVLYFLISCATESGQTVKHNFNISDSCRLGYKHTYGEKPESDNNCGNVSIRIEHDNLRYEGLTLKWKVEY